MDFILDHRLKNPEVCGTNKQSSGVDIEDVAYQKYLKELFPEDLEKIYKVFPMARIVMLKANNKEEQK